MTWPEAIVEVFRVLAYVAVAAFFFRWVLRD